MLRNFVLRAAGWAAPLALAWWVVVEGRPGSWLVGLPTVALAALVAAFAISPFQHSIRPAAILSFGWYFASQSVKGGVDVARRALAPSMPIAPGFVELTTSLPEGAARVLFADASSLLPGTLTVEVVADRVLVHGLDAGPALLAAARQLEARVADLLRLPPPGRAP